MDPVIYAVALVSFLLGSFGYVTTRFLLLPIGKYGRAKKRIARILNDIDKQTHGRQGGESGTWHTGGPAKAIRQLSAELSDCYTDHLPHWYRLYIEGRRGESPLEAAKQLMALSNTRNEDHATGQVAAIRKCLKLKPNSGQ